MKNTTFSSKADTAYGKPVNPPVPYSGSFDAYENVGEIRSANDWPSDDEILALRNSERKAKAISKARVDALDAAGYKKPEANDPVQVFAAQVKTLKLAGKSEAKAIALATEILGYNADGYVVDESGNATSEKAVAVAAA